MSDETPDVFKSIQRKPGLQIWTINSMKMVPVPEQAYGNFFEGDCYIITIMDPARSTDIHYWIGNTSSQDEQGSAAIYVTQMDSFLGGSPVQHREVQSCESAKFRSYFKNGLIYKKGGVASGFQHVETNVYNIRRLLHVKGTKNVTATEVEVSWNSFNSGDVFLLDMGKMIVQWNGPQSNRQEKLKGVLLAQDIRDRERGGRAQIGLVEGGSEEDGPELMKMMRAVLGQRAGQLRDAIPDDQPDFYQTAHVRLYSVSDASGKLVVQEVATQPLTKDLLQSSDCFIVDQGGAAIFVWKGKHATKEERHAALSNAVGFIKAKNYPTTTNVEVMCEGAESATFKQLFKSWMEKGQTQGLGKTYSVGKIAKVDQAKFDVMELHARPELAAQQRMVDDASGEVKIWRIENLELQEVSPSTYGQFYGGDCYLVLYSYMRSSQPQYILYMWLVRILEDSVQLTHSHVQYNAHCIITVYLNTVLQTWYTNCITLCIPGVVNTSTGVRLFQVRGTDEFNTQATEVPPRSSSLNSNDVFILKADNVCYLWYGKGCSGDEREMGKAISDVVSRQDKQIVMEGQEPAQFWVALGGKAPYASDKRFEKETPLYTPRLFECSNQTGRFLMTEVQDFAQEDLDEDDVMLLDTWEEVFLWIGNSANQYETQEASKSAVEYLRTHPAGRDPNTPIITVKQGYEPPTFTGWFSAWDPHKWSGGLSYEEMKQKLRDVGSVSQITVVNIKPSQSSAGNSGTYSPEQLLNKNPNELPAGVDPNRREAYLSDADFESVLGSSRADFQRLPKWRQSDLKKKAGLF
uniref:HP domain-containing protein n=1 Tax=Denticeps clupeoides TaxID=299321 RepID=A0AAY4B1D0_9TELE